MNILHILNKLAINYKILNVDFKYLKRKQSLTFEHFQETFQHRPNVNINIQLPDK